MKKQSTKSIFTSIYIREADSIFRYCFFRVSNREQALDIVQETFLRYWQTLEQGRAVDKIKPFLFTVAHRLIIDWYRKKKSISFDDLASEEGIEEYDPASESAFADLEMASEGRFLIDSIRKLSSSYRQVVYLRFVEGLPPPEIAEMLGVSTNTASVRINRGLQELRKITGYDGRGSGDFKYNG